MVSSMAKTWAFRGLFLIFLALFSWGCGGSAKGASSPGSSGGEAEATSADHDGIADPQDEAPPAEASERAVYAGNAPAPPPPAPGGVAQAGPPPAGPAKPAPVMRPEPAKKSEDK